MIWYLSFGIGFWLGAALKSTDAMRAASLKDFVYGILFGVFLWPIAILVMYMGVK